MRSGSEGWWRRNRLGLLAIPLLVVLVVVANGIRVEKYWWDTELRSATTAVPGEFVTFRQDYDDFLGPTSRTLAVRLDGVEELTAVPQSYGEPQSIPEGMRALQVNLSFEAEPDQSVTGCWLALVDGDGNHYEFDEGFLDISQAEPFPCHELASPGPRSPFLEGQTRDVAPGEERPESWQMAPVILVPEDAEITEARMWWQPPEYLSLPVQ